MGWCVVTSLDIVTERYPATVHLGGLAIPIALAIALPVGVCSAVRRGTSLDLFARAFAAFDQAVRHSGSAEYVTPA